MRTKLQFCVYGTYRWEKMEHNSDTYVAAFPYPVFEHLRVTQVSEEKEVLYEPQGTRPSDVPKIFKAIATRALATEIMGTVVAQICRSFPVGGESCLIHIRTPDLQIHCIGKFKRMFGAEHGY